MAIRFDIWLLGLPLAAALAAAAAMRTAPEVESRLRVGVLAIERQSPAAALAAASARVEVEGRELTITSDAALAEAARAEALRVAAALPGLRGPIFKVLPPASVEPFTFAASRVGGDLVLEGFVSPGESRIELIRLAGADGASVRDELRTALGAPDGFGRAARAAVDIARLLADAKVALVDRTVEASGSAADSGAYRRARELARSLPAGFAAVRIDVVPPLAGPFVWSATREGDSVVLAGNVPSEPQRDAVLAAVEAASPGAAVTDRMDTARGLEPGIDYDAAARTVLPILVRLQEGRVELRGRMLTVDGRLAARDLLKPLEAEIRRARLPGIELGRVDLQPIPASPYRLQARRAEGRLRLSGYLPDEQARSAIRDLVRRRFPFDTIADDLHLADGAPDGIVAVASRGLDRLSTLAEGSLAVEDRKVRLEGRGLYPEQTARIGREFGSDVAPGWTATASVGAAAPDKPLDPDFCSDLLADEVRRQPIGFEAGRPELSAAGRKALGGAAELMRRCGPVTIAAVVEVQSSGDLESARQLAERRSAGIAAFLAESGIAAEAQPRASKVAEPAKPADRVTFEVRP